MGERGVWYSLTWPIQGCATGQGTVFGLSVLNRVYNFMGVCLKEGLNLSLTARVWSVQLSSLNMAYRVLI